MTSPSPQTMALLNSLSVGCKVMVERPNEEPRKAEILSIREKKQQTSRLLRRKETEGVQETGLEYYVHYQDFNKRLDEWISGSRIITSDPVEWPTTNPSISHTSSMPNIAPTSPSPAPSRKLSRAITQPSPSATPTTTKRGSLIKQGTGEQSLLKKAVFRASTSSIVGLKRKAEELEDETPSSGTPVHDPDIDASTSAADEDEEVASQDDMTSVVDGDIPSSPQVETDGDYTPVNDEDFEGEAVIKVEVTEDEDEEMDEGDEAVEDLSNTRYTLKKKATDSAALDPLNTFSKAEEIEKLRTSGSMTQSHHEISRVKNLNLIQIGKHLIEAWYFSPYPVEYSISRSNDSALYVCEFCLSYFGSEKMFERHRKCKCLLIHPPGNEIYRHEDISFFEIDGRKQKTWCRNLCLLSKCFLDHKTLYYDVDPFLFYVLTQRDDKGHHIIGYFSKEKESSENYNVACILTLPHHQRSGWGKLLIEFSYELSKKEGKTGSPEKPLSDLGLLSYRAYWAEVIVQMLLDKCTDGNGQEEISIDEIAHKTSITNTDIMHTCQALQILKYTKNGYHLQVSDIVIAKHQRTMAKQRRRIAPEKLKDWKPPMFSRNDLRFGY